MWLWVIDGMTEVGAARQFLPKRLQLSTLPPQKDQTCSSSDTLESNLEKFIFARLRDNGMIVYFEHSNLANDLQEKFQWHSLELVSSYHCDIEEYFKVEVVLEVIHEWIKLICCSEGEN